MSVPSWAVPGKKVVTIRNFAEAQRIGDLGYRIMPQIGVVYTIRATEDYPRHGAVAVFPCEFPVDHGFDLRGFRPLVNDDTEAQLYHEAKKHGKLKAPARPEVDA